MEGRDATRVRCIAPYTAIFAVIQQLSIQRNIQPLYSKFDRRLIPRARPQMSQTTATFLAEHDLSSYTAAFDEHGWDSLPALQDISDDDLKQLVTDVAMKSGHAARLRTALGKAPAAAATAPAENVPAVLAAPAAAGQSDQGAR